MIDIKIYGTIVFFVVFAGGGGEKEFNAVIFNKKNFTVVWNHKYSWKTLFVDFVDHPNHVFTSPPTYFHIFVFVNHITLSVTDIQCTLSVHSLFS